LKIVGLFVPLRADAEAGREGPDIAPHGEALHHQ
jgi:hypothetical protein